MNDYQMFLFAAIINFVLCFSGLVQNVDTMQHTLFTKLSSSPVNQTQTQ